MNPTIRIGSVRGIPIGMHWSLLLVFALVVLVLSEALFPAAHPDQPAGAYVLAGVFTGAVFFGSVVAHELGHALVAQRHGVRVEGITLWLFGGVARFENPPSSPGDELRIAIVGPAVSVLAGLAFGVLWALSAVAGLSPLVSASLGWLAIINIALAVFNMVPAAPLDGGRVLRALLWKRTGDPGEATRRAARGGRVFGVALIVVGLIEVLFGMFAGIWLMLIGWFLVIAARGEETSSWLSGHTVADVMGREVVTAPDWLTVQAFLNDYVFTHRFSTFPLRGFTGELTGLVTLGHLKRVPPDRRGQARVRDIATPIAEVPIVHPSDDLVQIMGRVSGGRAEGRALVMDSDELVGILTPTDVARVVNLGPLRPHETTAGS